MAPLLPERFTANKKRTLGCGLLLCTVLFVPWLVLAEASPLTVFRGGGMYITTESPTLRNEGVIIDCSVSTAGCAPLNRMACTGKPLPIRFTLGQPLSQAAPTYVGGTQSVYAFLSTTPSCIYSNNTSQVAANGNLIGTSTGMPSSSVFFAGGYNAFTFPTELATIEPSASSDPVNKVFTTVDLLKLLNVCPEYGGTPVNLTPVYICVGVDGTGNKGGINNATAATSASTATNSSISATGSTSASSDLFGYMALQIDTSPPSAPTALSVTPKNGRARVSVSYDASLLDVYRVKVAYTRDASDIAAGAALDANGVAAGCAAWTHGDSELLDVKGVADGNNKVFSVSGLENGVAYSFCATTQDFLQNNSAPSAVQTATPREECDLFSCYSGTLRIGYCASQDLPALWSAAAAAAAWAAARRRRRRRLPPAQSGTRVGLGIAVALWGATAYAAQPQRPPWLDAEPPVSTERRQIHNEQSEPPIDSRRAQRAPVRFGDPRGEQLKYGPKAPRMPRWSLEVQLGPYRPHIGGGQLGKLYDLIYAQHDHSLFHGRPLRTRISGAFFPFVGLASGPYAGVAFWHASGASRICGTADAPVACTPDTVTDSLRGNDSSTLWAVPVSIGWQHTQDLRRLLHTPLGVGARAGLVSTLWWGSNGAAASRYRGRRAQGNTVNAELSAHLSFDVSAAIKQDADASIHGLIVAEYTYLPPGALFGSDRAHRLDFGVPWMVTLGIRAYFLK